MKKSRAFGLGLLATGASLYATGFPKRLGLTASEALISLPGDLLVPRADVQVDRAVRINAPASTVWTIIETALEDESLVKAKEEESCIILNAPKPGTEGEEIDQMGTCVLALLDLGNGRTMLHMRERHTSDGTNTDKAKLYGLLSLETYGAMMMLRDIRKAAESI